MSVQPFILWFLVAFTSAVLGQVIGARMGSPWLSGTAALLLPVMATLVALCVNQPYWHRCTGPADVATQITAAGRNALLMAWSWGAGAASMLAVYLFSGLRWQHGWQYGAGMAVFAALGALYATQIDRPGSTLRRPLVLDAACLVAALQGIAAIGGVMVLVLSGKVTSQKADWAANIIFVAGGIAITVLSAIAVRTHARLSPDDRDGRPES